MTKGKESTGAGNERPVTGAIARLLDERGRVESVAAADDVGRYHLSDFRPGDYRIEMEAFGYDPLRSLLLSIGDDSYPVDFELTRAPLPLPGVTVEAMRFEEFEDELRLMLGLHPASLSFMPIYRPEIESHVAKAHDVTDVIRWSNEPSIVVYQQDDGPCFLWRNRRCLPVYLNDVKVARELVPILPLDMVETIVVTGPNGVTEVWRSHSAVHLRMDRGQASMTGERPADSQLALGVAPGESASIPVRVHLEAC